MAFDGTAFYNECENGIVDKKRVWWVQAEAVIGFLNGYQAAPEQTRYLEAAKTLWDYIQNYVVDKREGSEWFWALTEDNQPMEDKPIVEPWKCPYHNGRMCLEIIRRNLHVS
jgi:mannobiose 2-epimerase